MSKFWYHFKGWLAFVGALAIIFSPLMLVALYPQPTKGIISALSCKEVLNGSIR